jgi:hypothetical protein
MNYKLGKLPARPDAVSLKFGAFFNAEALPTPPAKFGHYGIGIGLNWGMLANDRHSDCLFAGAAHEHMVWTHRSGTGEPVAFNDAVVLADYSAATGFDPTNPATDQGGDMQATASYRRNVGISDASGARHKIDAYVALRPGDVDQFILATYLFSATGVGLQLPDSAEKQFDAGVPWSVIPGAKIVGGHYVPCIGRNSDGNLLVVTWNRLQAVEPPFMNAYCDEGLAYISLDPLKNDLSPEGFNLDQLRRDLVTVTT